jgi:hypothetical protein
LGGLGEAQSIAVRDTNTRDWRLVVEAQERGRSGKLSNTRRLLVLLKDSSESVRAAAAENLGKLMSGYGDPANAITAGGENFGEIAEGVGQIAERVTILPFEVAGFRSGLIAAASDPSPRVRAASVDALASNLEVITPKPRRAKSKRL